MPGRTRGLQGSVVGAGLAELFYNVKVIKAHGLSGPWEEDAESWHGEPGSLEVLQVAPPTAQTLRLGKHHLATHETLVPLTLDSTDPRRENAGDKCGGCCAFRPLGMENACLPTGADSLLSSG